MAEGMMASIYRIVLGCRCEPPFPRMPYAEAIDRFGIDKPDLRFGLELKNLTAAFAGTSFKVFADVLARGEVDLRNRRARRITAQPPRTRRADRVDKDRAMGWVWPGSK